MKRLAASTLAIAIALASASAEAAPLSVVVSGTPGAGEVTLSLSGSQIARESGVFGELGDDDQPELVSQFLDFGDFTSFNLSVFGASSGLGTISVSSGGTLASQTVSAILLDTDNDGLDDFAFSFGGPTLSFMAGNVVSFAGTVVVAGLDIGDLMAGIFTSRANSGFSSLSEALDQRLQIGSATPVPAPATLPLLAGAAGLLALPRRRRGGGETLRPE